MSASRLRDPETCRAAVGTLAGDSAWFRHPPANVVRPTANTGYAALCAIGLTTPAAADDVPTATPTTRPAPLPGSSRTFSPYDALKERAGSMPLARSYPRSFYTYDALIEYASEIAITQNATNDRLAELTVREEAARRALARVFDPRVRGGLLRSRTDVMDDATPKALRTQLADDAVIRHQLLAAGGVVAPAASWHLPLVGENTQDFGPTPYWFEPALTYQGNYYRNFHAGTDIAAPDRSALYDRGLDLSPDQGPYPTGRRMSPRVVR